MRKYTSQVYSYIHLPIVAPERKLRDAWRTAMRNRDFIYRTIPLSQIPDLVRQIEASEDDDEGMEYSLFWQVFKAYYKRSIKKENRVNVARAFVEAAAARGGMAVLMCAEEYQPNFADMTQEEQDHCYCHRYTLAKQIAQKLVTESGYRFVRLHNLDLFDFREQWRESGNDSLTGYRPDGYCYDGDQKKWVREFNSELGDFK